MIHIEDLPADEFIAVLRKLPSLIGQEKLDGANLWLGMDEEGKLFTSREGKRANSDRRYNADDWPLIAAFNQFRAAHAALEACEEQIRKIMVPGMMVEVEVLFGPQPNSVMYGSGGKSFIAFLRGVQGTPDAVADDLAKTLVNKQVDISVTVVDTTDGNDLQKVQQGFQFQFTVAQKISPEKLKLPDLDAKLVQLESFLRKKSQIAGMTNTELLSASLIKTPVADREAVKVARAELLAHVQTEFKLPIKNTVLDSVVRKLRSSLSDSNIAEHDDIGIEGIVLRDPASGNQFKVVDKDIFGTVNKFNQAARQEIQSSLNTVDPDAPIESRGGLLGELKIRIAEVLGNRDMAKSSNMRKILGATKGNSPQETIKNFAGSMAAIDYQTSRRKILAMISETSKELAVKLTEFTEGKGSYRLKLKNGKELGLSQETVKKTLLTYAEAKEQLIKLFDSIKGTNSLAQLLAVLYGSQAKSVHLAESLTENKKPAKFKHKKIGHKKYKKPKGHAFGEIDKSTYAVDSTYDLVNRYMSTVFMAMVIFHTGDRSGMNRLRDTKNMTLKHWSRDMSLLNHWGYIIWRVTHADVEKILPGNIETELYRGTRHIPGPWWRLLHMELSSDNQMAVQWEDHYRTLKRLVDLTGLRTERLNMLLDGAVHWPALTFDQKIKFLNKLTMHAMQFLPRSTLFSRIRIIQQNLLVDATGQNYQMVENLLKTIALAEDDVAGGVPVGVPVGTQAAAIQSVPTRIGGAGMVVRRKRNPAIKKLMMKFPDPRTKDTK